MHTAIHTRTYKINLRPSGSTTMCKRYIYIRRCRVAACRAPRSRMQPRNVYCKAARKARHLGRCPGGADILELDGDLAGPCDRCSGRSSPPPTDPDQGEEQQQQQQQQQEQEQLTQQRVSEKNVPSHHNGSETVDGMGGGEDAPPAPQAPKKRALDLFREVFEKPLRQMDRDHAMHKRRKFQLRIRRKASDSPRGGDQEEDTEEQELEEETWFEVQSSTQKSETADADGDEDLGDLQLEAKGASAVNDYYGFPTGR
jgi:hypothetical protein